MASVAMTLRHILLNQLVYLKEAGYEVHAISSSGKGQMEVESAGIIVHSVDIQRRISPLSDLGALLQLCRLFRSEQYDLVHTHTPKGTLLGQLAAWFAGVPVTVSTVHGFYFHQHMRPLLRRFYIGLERVAARTTDLLLSQSREDVATAVREGICPADKIIHLGNGIDVQRFDPMRVDRRRVQALRDQLSINEGQKVVGMVGRLVREKGYLEYLAAADLVRRRVPGVVFLVIGSADSSDRGALSAAIAGEYGLHDAVRFLGWRDDMPEMYGLMDVLAFTSHREGFPRTVMEASAMGIPVVATDIRGNREAVAEGRNGRLVPLFDVPALADAVCDLLQNPHVAQRMGQEGRKVALERFDERIVFSKVASAYRALLSRRVASGNSRPSG